MSKAKKVTTIKDTLKAAKRLLQRVGWVQGEPKKYSSHGKLIRYCLLGALSHVNTSDNIRFKAIEKLEQEVKKDFPIAGIVSFNDYFGRTKQQVIDVIDSAISHTR